MPESLRTKPVASYTAGSFDQRMDAMALPERWLVVFDDRKLHLLGRGTTSSIALPTIESARADRLRRGGALFRTPRGFGVFLRERVLLWDALPSHPFAAPDRELPVEESAMAAPQTLPDGHVVERSFYVETAAWLDSLGELWVVVTDTYRKYVGRLRLDEARALWTQKPVISEIGLLRTLAQDLDRAGAGNDEEPRALATDGSDTVLVRIGGAHELRTVHAPDDASVLRVSKDGRCLFVFSRAKDKLSLTLFSAGARTIGDVALTQKSVAPLRVEPGWMIAEAAGGDLWIGGHGVVVGRSAYVCLEILPTR